MRPDIILLDAHWPRRALLRAQLIEEGYEVVATDDWPTVRSYVEALLKPRLVIVDLQDLPAAETVLNELHAHIQPGHVLALTALGTIPPEELTKRGFHTAERPATVGDIVRKVADLVKR